jgi:hypothetical protein
VPVHAAHCRCQHIVSQLAGVKLRDCGRLARPCMSAGQGLDFCVVVLGRHATMPETSEGTLLMPLVGCIGVIVQVW